MKPNPVNTALATAFLILGLVLGGFTGAWYEGRGNADRAAATADATEALTRSDKAELSQLRARADWMGVHLRLGRIALEADRQDYGSAGERAASLFDDIAQLARTPALSDSQRRALESVLAARDELVAGLATAQPSATQRLKELYLQLFDVTGP